MVECLEFRIENSNPTGSSGATSPLHALSSPLHYGKFVFPQYKRGQGITLANSLRRVLLYDVGGIGITHLRARIQKLSPGTHFRGVPDQTEALHEFSSIPGMRESVLELLVNLRAVVWKSSVSEIHSQEGSAPFQLGKIHTFSLARTLQDARVAKDGAQHQPAQPQKIPQGSQSFILQAKHLGNEYIIDPDQYLATILVDQCPDFEIDYILGDHSGILRTEPLETSLDPRNFSPNGSSKESSIQFQEEFQSVWLPTDGNFFPVKKVNYSIEESGTGIGSTSGNSAVGNIPYSETVFLEIWTNGGLHPQEALNQALRILVKLFGG